MQQLVQRLAGAATEYTRTQFQSVGQSQWSATYGFKNLPVRDVRTGKVVPVSGTMEIVVESRPSQKARALQTSVETDHLLTPRPYWR